MGTSFPTVYDRYILLLIVRIYIKYTLFTLFNTPFPISLARGRIRFWSVVIYFGSRMFFFLWRLVRSRQNGERAGPLARMLLGAKQRGRPRIVSRIIVEEYVALWVFPTCSTAMFLSFRSIYRNLLQILGYVTKVQSIDRVSISRVVASLRERGNRAAAYAVRICIFGAEQHISKRHSPD